MKNTANSIMKNTANSIELLAKRKNQFEIALQQTGITADKFIRMAITTIRQNNELLNCTPESVLGSLFECAQIGLFPDTNLAYVYFIPYKNKCTLRISYKGWRTLAYRSGKYESIYANYVCENDDFKITNGSNPRDRKFFHSWGLKDRVEIIGYYAEAHYKNSDNYEFELLNLHDILRHKAKAQTDKIWKEFPEAMGKKCAIKKLCQRLNLEMEHNALSEAIIADGRVIEADADGNITINEQVDEFNNEEQTEQHEKELDDLLSEQDNNDAICDEAKDFFNNKEDK